MSETYPNVVYEDESYFIQVNSQTQCTYIQLWNKGKRKNEIVGKLTTVSKIHDSNLSKDYIEIGVVEVAKKHQGLGYGLKLYQILLKYMDKNKKGIISYLPDRYNKKQVPAIYKKLKGKVVGDLAIIERV
jgi:predicted GNAT family acetyltransferase